MSQTLSGSLQYRTETGASDSEVGQHFAKGTSKESWKSTGIRLGKLERHLPWKLGDWAFHGELEYGSRYDEMCELTGLEYGTLANYASVAGRIDISRRHENLSFSHHQEVASLGSDEEQDAWLNRAAEQGLSSKDLRALLAEQRKGPTLPEAADQLVESVEPANASSEDADVETGVPAATESAELQRHLEAMRLEITLDDVRKIQPRAEAEDMTPADWLRRFLDGIMP